MFIEEDVDIMGTLKEIKISCNPKKKKNRLVVQPNASYVNGGMDQLMQFHCFANGKIMCPIKKMPLLSGKKKRMAMRNYISAQQVLWKNNAWAQANRNSLIH